MNNDTPHGGKAKIIAWCIAIAAVAIIYIFVTGRSHGASSALTANSTASSMQAPAATGSAGSTSTVSSNATFKDGSYTASNNYQVPNGVEGMSVTLTVANGSVTGVSINQSASNGTSAEYQAAFASAYKSYVVGQKLSAVQLSRVSGASLTSDAFDQAIMQIESQAKA